MRAELKPHEAGTRGVRRIVRQQVSSALELLRKKKLTDADVHAARKELKKSRATLRLLRGAFTDAVYERENSALRDAARPLSISRDAKVLLDALDALVAYYGPAARAMKLDGFRKVLRRERVQARRAMTPAVIARPRSALRQVHERSARWRIGQHDWNVIGVGLKRVYSKGCKGLAAARSSRSAEDLHEWRKQVKYLWHELQVLEPMCPGLIGELADQAHKLANYLGDDHDLAVLRENVFANEDAFPDAATRRALLALIDRCRIRLQDKALVLGNRIYKEKPKVFVARFGQYWSDWQRENRAPADQAGASA